MSQINNHRRGRAIRRGLAVFLILVIGPAAYLVYDLTRDRTPEVRMAVLGNGSITSIMTITTSIRPGAVQQTNINQQMVKDVLVKSGDQVKKGDPLITFDLTGLTEQLTSAAELRRQAETAAGQVTELAASQAADAQQSMSSIQTQISRLSSGLSGSVQAISNLGGTLPNEITVDDNLVESVVTQMKAVDMASPDAPAQIRFLLQTLTTGIRIIDNPDYQQQMAALNKSVTRMSSALSGLMNSLTSTSTLTGLLGGSSAAGQLTSLATSAQTAVAQAKQAEAIAQSAVDNAKEIIYAEIDGVVAQVSAVAGQYAGAAASSLSGSLSGSLSSLLGSSAANPAESSLSSLSASSNPVIVIYDNTRPKAFFQANRFDSAKLAVGMPVIYRQDNRTWQGKVTYKGRIASNVSLDGGSSGSLLGSVSSVSGLGTEPMIDLEMSILGDNLTDLTLGFNLDAEIQTATADNVLLLPAEAMKKELGEYYVYVVGADNRLLRRVFKPGIQSDLYAEVLEGLQLGERVVLNPSNDLSAGLLVKEKADG